MEILKQSLNDHMSQILKKKFLSWVLSWTGWQQRSLLTLKILLLRKFKTLDLGHLVTMYHVLLFKLPGHQFYEKTVLKYIFNILFWVIILVSKQTYIQDFYFLPTEIFFKSWDLLVVYLKSIKIAYQQYLNKKTDLFVE